MATWHGNIQILGKADILLMSKSWQRTINYKEIITINALGVASYKLHKGFKFLSTMLN